MYHDLAATEVLDWKAKVVLVLGYLGNFFFLDWVEIFPNLLSFLQDALHAAAGYSLRK